MTGRPKAGFWVVVIIVALGLTGYALYNAGILDKIFPRGSQGQEGSFSDEELKKLTAVEAGDQNTPTTVKEYTFVPATKLPPVKGTSSYKKMEDNTVLFALNVWAGWAPIVWANRGFDAGKEWVSPTGRKFKVKLVLIDDPVAMRDSYAAGEVHIGWATLDMMPLFMEELRKDSRIMPRIYQQIDWSNGGDGIVGREVNNIGELRGKTIVLAQNSPSHYFVLNALLNVGIQPSEVNFVFTQDAFQAAAAFNNDKKISACVSWAPDIYKLAEVPGNKLLVTTQTANKLIADVWFARADFAKDNIDDIIEGLVRGIFDAIEELKDENNKKEVAKLMAAGYSISTDEAYAMLSDAHNTNYAENLKLRQGSQREEALRKSKMMLSALSYDDRQRYERLRSLCIQLRKIAKGVAGEPEHEVAVIDDIRSSGINKLLWIYLKLLYSKASLEKFFKTIDEREIESEIEKLKARIEELGPEEEDSPSESKQRKSLVDTFNTSELRLKNYRLARENYRLIQIELDRLYSKIAGLSELSINRADPDFISREVDSVSESVQQTERAMDELEFITGITAHDETAPPLIEERELSKT